MNIMKEYGYIDVVFNAEEAIQVYDNAYKKSDPYDLILLDRIMPGKDGDAVLAHIKNYEVENNFRSFEKCKVIMVTALNHPDDVFSSFRNQCDGYIIKPISKEKVLNAIENARIKLKKIY